MASSEKTVPVVIRKPDGQKVVVGEAVVVMDGGDVKVEAFIARDYISMFHTEDLNQISLGPYKV